MAGRTVSKYIRVYYDGYDVSGYASKIGPLQWEFNPADLTTFSDAVHGYLAELCMINVGTLNGNFDNTATSGLHALASAGAGSKHLVTNIPNERPKIQRA